MSPRSAIPVSRASAAVLLVAAGSVGVALLTRIDPGDKQRLTAGAPAARAPAATWRAPLREQAGSGRSGSVVLTSTADGRTRVEISLAGSGPAPLPAHVYVGTCSSTRSVPKFALATVEIGRSETTVPVPLQELLDGKFSISVQEAGPAGPGASLACGEIVGG